MISAIVAVDKDWGIGFEGQLLEHLPPDMKHFKETTVGNIVIMGRKTWDSLPVKPLPNRTNVVITSKETFYAQCGKGNIPTLYSNLNQVKLILNGRLYDQNKEVFVIGGGQIYKELLPYCDRVYVTFIGKSHDNVDTYFPNLDKDPNWEVSTCTELRDYKDIPYAFLTYDRIS